MKKASGYRQPCYYEGGIAKADNYRMHAWTADHARDHIGGTMQPIQATPHFSRSTSSSTNIWAATISAPETVSSMS